MAEERHRGQDPGRARVHAAHTAGLQRGVPQAQDILASQYTAGCEYHEETTTVFCLTHNV